MQAILHIATGVINLNYGNMSSTDYLGATIGVENSNGTAGTQITYNSAGWSPGSYTSLEIVPRDVQHSQGSANVGIGAAGAGYQFSGNGQFGGVGDIGAKNVAIGMHVLGWPFNNTNSILDTYQTNGGGNYGVWGGNTAIGSFIFAWDTLDTLFKSYW